LTIIQFATEFWPHITFVIASAVGLYRWRVSELRHSDALAWSNRCIEVLQRTYLKMKAAVSGLPISNDDFQGLADEASILVEQGRLLFRNVRNGYGKDKPTAYQGLRPKILDWVLCVHEAASRWEAASSAERTLLLHAVETAERNFVSLAQREVGRARTSSKFTRAAGDGMPLDKLIEEMKSNGHR
jgi:hypothetical protein